MILPFANNLFTTLVEYQPSLLVKPLFLLSSAFIFISCWDVIDITCVITWLWPLTFTPISSSPPCFRLTKCECVFFLILRFIRVTRFVVLGWRYLELLLLLLLLLLRDFWVLLLTSDLGGLIFWDRIDGVSCRVSWLIFFFFLNGLWITYLLRTFNIMPVSVPWFTVSFFIRALPQSLFKWFGFFSSSSLTLVVHEFH